MQQSDLPDQLEQLLATGALPRNGQASTAMLLARLQSVITVRVMGPDRDSKTRLVSALVGCQLPDIPSAEIWVRHGEAHEITLQYHDGSSALFERGNQIDELTPVRIDVVAPHPALELVSLHLIGELDEAAGERLTGSHAFQDADIVLWCTSSFTTSEAVQWSSAPDQLKDHSFLVRMAPGEPSDSAVLDMLDEVAEQQFYALHHVGTADGETKASARLMSKIFQIAKSGRTADLDCAALLLKTHERTLAQAGPLETGNMPIRRPLLAPKKMTGVYSTALDVIQTCAAGISDPYPEECNDALSRVLGQCAEASQSLAELFEDETDDDAGFQGLKRDILASSDQLTLMTLEEGIQPALDAVTTLLQLKREIEFRCAA